MNTQPQPPRKPLKDALFERIETEHVCPRSKLFFQGRECVVWSLWLMSILVGALAIAVSAFVMTHFQYELYEATHENFLTFIVDVLPYLWIIVFGLMVYVAMYNLQHTKNGYRYPVWVILASSILLSFVGGTSLQFFGFGYTIDNILGNQMPMYMSREKLEQKMWQAPEEGRLLGKQVFSTLAPTTTVIFEDMNGQRWRMDVSELDEREMELLASKKTVRLLGRELNKQAYIFHACGAFPWMMDKAVTMEEMDTERRLFIEKIEGHARKAKNQMVFGDSATFASAVLPEQSICSTIPPVRKMPIKPEVTGVE